MFFAATCVYFLSLIFFLIDRIYSKREYEKAGNLVALAAFLLHTAGLLLRSIERHGLVRVLLPDSVPYETMVIVPWIIMLRHFVFRYKSKVSGTGVFLTPFAVASMVWAHVNRNCDITRDYPAMDSNWPTYYVIATSAAYASFAIACAFSVAYITAARPSSPPLAYSFPPSETLENLIVKSMKAGVTILPLGIAVGMLWSNFALGYWSWTPLEEWSLLVWIMYAAVLFLHSTRKTSALSTSWASLTSFLFSVGSYIACNMFLVSHCY